MDFEMKLVCNVEYHELFLIKNSPFEFSIDREVNLAVRLVTAQEL